MAAFVENLRATLRGENSNIHFNWRTFVQEKIAASPLLALWLLLLTLFAVWFTAGQLRSLPVSTTLILIVWMVTLGMMIRGELIRRHTPMTRWLQENMYSSITNALISLILALGIIAAVWGFLTYALFNASFSLDPAVNAQVTDFGRSGARWGSVRANLANLLVFRMKDQAWRIWSTLAMLVVLGIPSLFVYRGDRHRGTWYRQLLTISWLFTPYMAFYFLRGFGAADQPFRYLGFAYALGAVALGVGAGIVQRRYGEGRGETMPWRLLNPLLGLVQYVVAPLLVVYSLSQFTGSGAFHALAIDQMWGGLLLTIIISLFAIVVSFPFGVLLALGRRSQLQGVPWWVTYPAAAVITVFMLRNVVAASAEASTVIGQVLVYWPVLIPLIAYLFQTIFKGNVVAAFCTAYIEVVRGVPLITLLFMSIILFPIFLPPDMEVLNTWRVMAAFALFSAAYLAENVRGGLQAIPRGQYEAADSLGLSSFNKYRLIILPQALRIVIPAIVGQFIGLFKDTSLVYLVGLFDFLEVANRISTQPDWQTIRTEPYIFLLVVYFFGSAAMATYSRYLERRTGVGER